MKIADLTSVLAFRHDDVVHRFAGEFQVSVVDAEEIFTETKRWLWICARRKVAVETGEATFVTFPLFNEARIIDLMWHTFLLYTEDYADFCDHYFGFFIHHKPKPRAERLAWRERIQNDPDGARRERESSLRIVYESLYEELGEEILIKWCEDFPRRFGSIGKRPVAHPQTPSAIP